MISSITELRRRLSKKDVPPDIQASDLFLVEFPKSGVTWLSTILANAALMRSGMSQRATFFSVSQFIPDIHVTGGRIGTLPYSSPPFRMIKSHAEYNPCYQHAIYLVRHPHSVMRSYYAFLGEHQKKFKDVESFLANTRFGLPAWKRHVKSWLQSANQSARLHLIRYEDLVSDPADTIGVVNSNLGLGFEEGEIQEAIQLSCIERMRESEALYASRNPRYRLSFVGGKREDFPRSIVDMIESECGPELDLAGYR